MLIVKGETAINLDFVTSFKLFESECYILFNFNAVDQDDNTCFVQFKFESEFRARKSFLLMIKAYANEERTVFFD